MIKFRKRWFMGSLLAGLLWLPSALWAACNTDFDATGAVSVYSLSGQGNFNCRDLTMSDVPAKEIVEPELSELELEPFAWELDNAAEVDAVVIEDSSGKRCVYNYGPGATGGSGLTPPSDKPVAKFLFCADDFVQKPPNTAPVVSITAPADPSTFAGGEEIVFSGTADDNEDGDLASLLTWSSSLDGPIGDGAGITVSDLSAGEHRITAQATDFGGLVGSTEIWVTVEALVAQNCEVSADGTSVEINGVEVLCPTETDPDGNPLPRLVCSADLSPDADKFRLGNTACCLCNATATECDADLAEGEIDPVTGLDACPDSTAVKGSLQVPSTLMFNNDPFYCYTIGGQRTCFRY